MSYAPPGKTGEPAHVLRDVSISVPECEFVSLVGPSGCGKSTLLQIAAGLTSPTSGQVIANGQQVSGPPEGVVYLFQQYSRSLFPWRTVIGNVAFGLESKSGLAAAEVERRCLDVLGRVGLAGFENHRTWQLSGGMQQRVAIARALAAEPSILLLDEPFSAVDALTRVELQNLLLQIWASQRLTVVLVTHDVDEAVYLSSRIAVLSQRPTSIDRLVEIDLPRPRDPIATRERPDFLAHRRELLNDLLNGARTQR